VVNLGRWLLGWLPGSRRTESCCNASRCRNSWARAAMALCTFSQSTPRHAFERSTGRRAGDDHHERDEVEMATHAGLSHANGAVVFGV
jgi:hypothetical protein